MVVIDNVKRAEAVNALASPALASTGKLSPDRGNVTPVDDV
jgi:hypothetical protein